MKKITLFSLLLIGCAHTSVVQTSPSKSPIKQVVFVPTVEEQILNQVPEKSDDILPTKECITNKDVSSVIEKIGIDDSWASTAKIINIAPVSITRVILTIRVQKTASYPGEINEVEIKVLADKATKTSMGLSLKLSSDKITTVYERKFLTHPELKVDFETLVLNSPTDQEKCFDKTVVNK